MEKSERGWQDVVLYGASLIVISLCAWIGGLYGGRIGSETNISNEIANIERKVSSLQGTQLSILKDLVVLESNMRQDVIGYRQLLQNFAQQAVAASKPAPEAGVIQEPGEATNE